MVSDRNESAVTVAHDGDGNRVSETAGGVTTKYLVDDLNPTGLPQVLDEKVSGSVTRTYAYGLQRISENQLVGGTWKPSFYGYDGHGNVRFLTNTAGTATDTYQYDAFGMPIASAGTTSNNYLYSGEQNDNNVGLYQLRARWYRPATGRFTTMDPYEGKILDPRTLHKYVYTRNDPVNVIDPSGRQVLVQYLIAQTITVRVIVVLVPEPLPVHAIHEPPDVLEELHLFFEVVDIRHKALLLAKLGQCDGEAFASEAALLNSVINDAFTGQPVNAASAGQNIAVTLGDCDVRAMEDITRPPQP